MICEQAQAKNAPACGQRGRRRKRKNALLLPSLVSKLHINWMHYGIRPGQRNFGYSRLASFIH
jgi:hypothetical protein